MDRVEKLTGKPVRDHMGFGNISRDALEYSKSYLSGYHGFGEMNHINNLHGRGIYMFFQGSIRIGYFNNKWSAPGNFIEIYSDGDVDVGQKYQKYGEIFSRGTRYKADGTSVNLDTVFQCLIF